MHADMIILLLSMLEGNVNTDAHSISGQMKEALVESRQVSCSQVHCLFSIAKSSILTISLLWYS